MKVLFLILSIFIFATNVVAQPGAYAGKKHELLFADLNLSAEQQKAVDELRASKPRPMAAMMQIKELRAQMSAMIKDKSVEDEKIYQKLEEINKLYSENTRNRVEHLIALRKILNAEQLDKLMLKMDSMKGGQQGMGKQGAQGKQMGNGTGQGKRNGS